MLFEDGIQVGEPNEPELEFWMRIQELESSLEIFKTTEKFVLEQYECVQQANIDAESKIKELEAQNKILIETDHWIGQDEAHGLKVVVKKFLDMTRLGRILDEEATVWEVPCWQMNELSKALRDSKFNSPPKHKAPPHSHPIHSPPQESEHPQTHEG